MTYTTVEPMPDGYELLGYELIEGVEIVTSEVTGRGFDSSRDEYHEETREIDSETKHISCPAETVVLVETDEEVEFETDDKRQEFLNELEDGKRVDYDAGEFSTPDGRTVRVIYDMTPFEKLIGEYE